MTLFNHNHAQASRRIVSGYDVFNEVEDNLRNLLRRLFMGQMSEARDSVNARIDEPGDKFARILRRHGLVVVGDDQVDRQSQARQVTIKRAQIPMRHHTERAGDMGRIAHQPLVEGGTARIDCRTCSVEQPPYGGGRGGPGEPARREWIKEQSFRQTRQHLSGDALEWRKGAVERNQPRGRNFAIERKPRGDGGASGMSDGDRRREIKDAQQTGDGARHAGQRERAVISLGEAMSGQVRRHDLETLREDRHKIAPGVCRRARSMQKQHGRSVAQDLDMPIDAAHPDASARGAVWPIDAVLFESKPAEGREHDARDYDADAAARTASDKRAASTKGSRR